MRFLCRVSLALVFLITATAFAQDLKIAYTGQLMGYYRQDVAAKPSDPPNPPKLLLKELTTDDAKGFKLILGMGDNFAPEFGAALYQPDGSNCLSNNPAKANGPFPRALYKTDLNPPNRAECDNVAGFLMQAGYRAIVPGKEDFIYGSFWLSTIGRLLNAESAPPDNKAFNNADRKMNLLAANLRLQVVGADGKPNTVCPLLFSPSAEWIHASPCDATKLPDPKETIEDIAYTSTDLGGAHTLIVGVVAQNLLDAVSQENRTFCASTIGPAPGYTSYTAVDCTTKGGMIKLQTVVSDPLQAVIQTITRAKLAAPAPYDTYIVMAQMTRGEAEELAAKLQARRTADPSFPPIALVLSSAFAEQSSGTYTLTGDYDEIGKVSALGLIPVLTPHPAYDGGRLNHKPQPLIDPLSAAELTIRSGKYTMANISSRQPLDGIRATQTTLGLLLDQIQPAQALIPRGVPSPEMMVTPCKSETLIANSDNKTVRDQIDGCNVQAMQYILAAMRNIKPWINDVVFLERRDFFFGALPEGYTGYEMCHEEDRFCQLEVALDRVLWKGDYIERVMATGADISAMIAASDAVSSQTKQLEQPTTTGSWLQTYGIVESGPVAAPDQFIPISVAGQSSTKFAIPTDPNCMTLPDPTTGQSKPTYCILSNSVEQTPQKDGGFWIATSDHLASDTTTYPALSKLPSTYRVTFKDSDGSTTYLTEAIAKSLFIPSPLKGQPAVVSTPRVDKVHGPELRMQQSPRFQVDFGKIFFGYLNSGAEGGDSYLANNYQGVSDTRASAVSQYELDAEAQLRGLWSWGNFWPYKTHVVHHSVGFQTDVEYDRSAQGNLNGAADNASYGANNWAIGPLYQFTYPLRPNTKPTNYGFMKTAGWAFVVSPQFQRQVRGTDLFFAYSSSSPKVGNDELTIPIAYSYGWNVKEGFRFTAASSPNRFQLQPGSYLEVGLEEGEQHHVLNSIELTNLSGAKLFCAANSVDPISSCVSSASKGSNPTFPLSSTTVVSALSYSDQPAHGLYWDISFKWTLFKSVNNFHEMDFVAASKGDAFVRRSASEVLSTQTLYDIPLNLGVTFQVLPNLSFAPAGNFFFYSNQIAERQLLIRGFNITMRWYYDRDFHVPLLRQLFLLGPASQDQTKSTKMKQTP